ncbi:MAG TPA: circularly permuted type 2 ATP-grasp protein [Microbacterium sp.]|uniref:circularly permuted type 2 ATP-grasp protein n=1 Tax=Microbacterium sp. TaxID=51671 RepID=UPI002B46E1C6|nr:circularly permuted type 2 ATP-grasp protein [Microbacterium sp.]HKT55407.1 circularly permuted type 2 ATP-grasp protein [Microbacterium sp.]
MSIIQDYARTASTGDGSGAYDEVVDADGLLRPAWREFAAVALDLEPAEVTRVADEVSRFLADDGVTWTAPVGESLPWRLDPMPFVLDPEAWAHLDAGLAQRAELWNAVLADLYGERTLLRHGILPAAAVFGHSGYLRPLVRPSAPAAQSLVLTAADLGRTPDGTWQVLADRLQAPSGLGYVMENRRVISQVIPELYQLGAPHRMAPYFAALRAALLGSAADGIADPRVVVLSPGPHSETAFDQAHIATVLGFPLVQGEDLLMRDGWVWLKPPGWPKRPATERVDVILRRVDPLWSDPLELRGDSRLGVAGLTEAVRRGRVQVVNGLGAGVLENPALAAFLPDACQALLGEPLRLAQAPTWWCGDDEARAFVLRRLADPDFEVLRIDEPAQPGTPVPATAPDALRARILAAPHLYVGRERPLLSRAPVWTDAGGASPHPVSLRMFTLRYGTAYRPLAGGLATAYDRTGTRIAKDVWVRKTDASEPDQGLADLDGDVVARLDTVLSPRSLENLFWAGRYSERAEDVLRMILAVDPELDELAATDPEAPGAGARSLLVPLHRLAGPPPGRAAASPVADIRSLLLDPQRIGGAAHSLGCLRDALEEVRDQLSGDTWRVLAGMTRAQRSLRINRHEHQIAESAGQMLGALLSLQGVTANMIRDAGWHLIEAGRSLERGLQVCRLLRATVVTTRPVRIEREVRDALVTCTESAVTFRRRYRGTARVGALVELLVADRQNPRSVAFAVDRLMEHVASLPASTGSTRAERLIRDLADRLRDLDAPALAASHNGRRAALEELLTDLVTQLEQVADATAELHFAGGLPPVALTDLSLIEEVG